MSDLADTRADTRAAAVQHAELDGTPRAPYTPLPEHLLHKATQHRAALAVEAA